MAKLEITKGHAKALNERHRKILKSAEEALEDAQEQGRDLLAVKDSLPHGSWRDWIAENLEFGLRTAERYVACWQNRKVIGQEKFTSLAQAYRLLTTPAPTAQQPKVSGDPSKKGKSDTPVAFEQEQCRTPASKEPEPEAEPVEVESVLLDETGYKIPPEALPIWERKQEVQDLLTMISRVKGALQKAFDDHDRMYCGKVSNSTMSDLGTLYAAVSNAKPYAICPDCKGKVKLPSGRECGYCAGSGWLSKWAWDRTEKVRQNKR